MDELEKKYKVGYTTGVFDLFHIGHLNIIKKAKEQCEYLIVGVSSDELTLKLKHRLPAIPYESRAAIIESIRYVDEVVLEDDVDKYKAWQKIKFDVLFKGSDAAKKEEYKEYEKLLKKENVDVVYFPYTNGISTSSIKTNIGKGNKMREDKEYCMSSYLSVRYVHDKNVCFKDGVMHKDHDMVPDSQKIACKTARDIDYNIKRILEKVDLSKAALFLSGGMDSGILASYMPAGTKAYTARCIGKNAKDETEMARKFCDINHLEHVIVDVSWEDYKELMDELMLSDGSPLIPNEAQAYKLAKLAKLDEATCIIYGDCADTEFGGMDRLLSKDWKFKEWIERFQFLNPEKVLKHPADITSIYESYRVNEDEIDFVKFISEVYVISASGALTNAIRLAGIASVDPYERLKMAEPLDIERVRSGDSKYLIRDLFRLKYPGMEIPEKIPMSRPADDWLKDWKGPTRDEFLPNCIDNLTGEQKLLVYCLERFLNLIDA